jgi:Ser/Thr protein kinase RdoA (MazF antagonist)
MRAVLDSDTIEAVTEAFQLGRGPWRCLAIARGSMGQIWRLSNDNSESYALKRLLWEWDEHEAEFSESFRVEAERVGITSGAPRRGADGRIHQNVMVGAGMCTFRAYAWVDGSPMNDLSDRRTRIQAVGGLLGKLHGLSIIASPIPPHPWYFRTPSVPEFESLLDRALRQEAGWATALQARRDRIFSIVERIEAAPCPDMIVSHLDVLPGNVLATSSGSLALIDWDTSGLGDPFGELCGALYTWHSVEIGERIEVHWSDIADSAQVYKSHRPRTTVHDYPEVFACATRLNHLFAQAQLNLDREVSGYLDDKAIESIVRGVPDAEVFEQIAKIVEGALEEPE